MSARVKLVLSYEDLRAALGIEEQTRVVSVYLSTDPDLVYVVCESDWFNDNPPHAQAPVASLEYVRP